MTNQNLDVLKLSDEIEKDSQSGDLAKELLERGNTLYSPDPKLPGHLRRRLPSGDVECGYLRDGGFVRTDVLSYGTNANKE